MIVVLKYKNDLVTDNYLRIIADAYKEVTADTVSMCDSIKALNKYNKKKDIIIVARIIDAFPLLIKGYKNVVIWFQGVSPEECYMKYKSKIKYFILSFMEKFVLKHSKFMFFVSMKMKKHYEEKYKIRINNNYYCMPCMNTDIKKDSFFYKNKYINNYFTYVGSMAVWQQFDKIAECYKKIEDLNLPNSHFYVFTSEKEKAEKIINKLNIKNYTIDYVDNGKLSEALKPIKYGFILRDDNVVNNVATPTKISSYLSCGVVPIYSSCLDDFNNVARNMKYVICDDDSVVNQIKQFSEEEIDNNKIYDEYLGVFESYYSEKNHKKNIINLLKK